MPQNQMLQGMSGMLYPQQPLLLNNFRPLLNLFPQQNYFPQNQLINYNEELLRNQIFQNINKRSYQTAFPSDPYHTQNNKRLWHP